MNRSKLLRLSIGLANSLSSRLSQLSVTQVTHLSQFTQFNPTSFPTKPFISNNYPFNFHKNVFFSSKPQSFISVLLANDWSVEIENELDKLSPNLTNEFVLYVLMNLENNPQKSLDFFSWVSLRKGFDPSFWPYFILLKTLACRGFMSDFWELFSEMKRKGFFIDYRSYSIINVKLTKEKLHTASIEWTKKYKELVENDAENEVVKSVEELISTSDWGEEVVGFLKETIRFPLTEAFVLRTIEELWKTPLKALKFFKWVESDGWYEHNIVSYNTMARVLANGESVCEFWDFVKQMRMDGYEIDIYTYTRCSKYLPINDVVKLYELMMDGPYQPLPQHTASLFKKISYELEPDLDLVYRVFDKYVDAGNTAMPATKSIYDGLHRAVCSLGMFDEAKKIFVEMRNFGYKPDNLTYSNEIFGLCKIQSFDEACKVIDQMGVEGCVPNVNTWTVLIEGLCVANRMDMALSCITKMNEQNVNTSPELLFVLVNGFISENKVLDAYRYFTELVNTDSQLKPSQNTYQLLIEKLAEGGHFEEALDILSRMKLHYRVFPRPITQYVSKCGTVEDAIRLLEVLPQNVAVYKKVINAFIEQGRHSDAKDLFRGSPLHVRANDGIHAMIVAGQAPPVDEAPVRASS